MEPFIGQIMMFGGNFAPRGWAFCDGQLLPISQYSALFSILGTTYGGDGVSTFGLPDLRGRAPMHAGTGPGLSPRPLGQRGGAEHVSLTSSQMPPHSHSLNGLGSAADNDNPANGALARSEIYAAGTPNRPMADGSVGSAGGGQPVSVESPYGVVNFCIALEGLYPPRS